MNERILELADKAAEGMTGLNIPDEFCKKFAELIIRECAHAADYVSSPGLSEGEVIKKHFGVEE
jgi:hypothetical protein